jgi:PD-(D/E)XK nuclease superfamily
VTVAVLVNEFSWSRTRDSIFQECRRRYYFQYYGAWGGWDLAADPITRRLYVLKQLGSRQMWAGRLVHEAIERALLAMRDGFALSEASLVEHTVRQMRSEWKGSRRGVYRANPHRPGLFEHEYAVPVRDGEWRALRDHVVRCLRNFYRLSLLAEIKKTSTDRWILIEDVGSFGFEGTTVFAAPDFGYWDAAGQLQLVDWKTGGNGGEDAALQLAGYALYAREVLGVDLPRVDLLEVNLREGRVTSHPWDHAGLRQVTEHIRLSVRGMKAYLRDPARNLAREADFEKTENLRICRWCNFRAVCRPDLPPFAVAEVSASSAVASVEGESAEVVAAGAGYGDGAGATLSPAPGVRWEAR